MLEEVFVRAHYKIKYLIIIHTCTTVAYTTTQRANMDLFCEIILVIVTRDIIRVRLSRTVQETQQKIAPEF